MVKGLVARYGKGSCGGMVKGLAVRDRFAPKGTYCMSLSSF